MTPTTEEQALLMYAAGLEYLKRTNSKLLPVAEQGTKPVAVPARKPVTAVDFDVLKNSEVTRLRKRVAELEAEVQRLIFENNIQKQPNTWPVRPMMPLFNNGTGVDPNAGFAVNVSSPGDLIIKGDTTLSGKLNTEP